MIVSNISETLNIHKDTLFPKIERVEFNPGVMSQFREQFNRIFAVRNLRLNASPRIHVARCTSQRVLLAEYTSGLARVNN